jgi:hypothetical protein
VVARANGGCDTAAAVWCEEEEEGAKGEAERGRKEWRARGRAGSVGQRKEGVWRRWQGTGAAWRLIPGASRPRSRRRRRRNGQGPTGGSYWSGLKIAFSIKFKNSKVVPNLKMVQKYEACLLKRGTFHLQGPQANSAPILKMQFKFKFAFLNKRKS